MPTPTYVVVVTPRPSDPTELVSIMDSTDFDPDDRAELLERAATTGTEVEIRFAAGATHVEATPSALDDYIESPGAEARGHLFLTI